jgi:hypothetical protein
MKLDISLPNFEKIFKTKFHGKLNSGSQLAPFGQTDRGTDMKKLIITSFN